MSPWKKTFYAAWLAQVVSITGFMFVLPFMPFYVRALGIRNDVDAAWWAGMVAAAAGFAMMVFAPIWGHLADRFGRRIMVLRSMFAGAVVLVLMAFCRNVHDLLLLRAVQGALTGTITASVALVASVTPRRHAGYTLGMMQSAVFLGASAGPLVGGFLIDRFGFRCSFLAAACVVAAGGFLVKFAAREQFTPPAKEDRRNHGTFRRVFAAGGFLAAVFVLFQIRFAGTAIAPVFALFVERLHGTSQGVATVTGGILATAGVVAALSAGIIGRFGDRWGHKRLLVVCTLFAGLVALPQAFVQDLPTLFVLRVLLGFAAAGIMPSANAIIHNITHRHNLGKAYGVTSSASSFGAACGPFAGGYLAAWMGLTAPFVLTGVLFVLAALLVGLFVRQPANNADAPDAQHP